VGVTDLFGLEEVLGIAQQHLLDSGVEHDRGYGPLVPGVSPAPTAMGVGEIYLYTVNGLGLVLLLGLENELFQDRVIARYDTV
jgi:hypothetical protein